MALFSTKLYVATFFNKKPHESLELYMKVNLLSGQKIQLQNIFFLSSSRHPFMTFGTQYTFYDINAAMSMTKTTSQVKFLFTFDHYYKNRKTFCCGFFISDAVSSGALWCDVMQYRVIAFIPCAFCHLQSYLIRSHPLQCNVIAMLKWYIVFKSRYLQTCQVIIH